MLHPIFNVALGSFLGCDPFIIDVGFMRVSADRLARYRARPVTLLTSPERIMANMFETSRKR
jgi:hypothetical protein